MEHFSLVDAKMLFKMKLEQAQRIEFGLKVVCIEYLDLQMSAWSHLIFFCPLNNYAKPRPFLIFICSEEKPEAKNYQIIYLKSTRS